MQQPTPVRDRLVTRLNALEAIHPWLATAYLLAIYAYAYPIVMTMGYIAAFRARPVLMTVVTLVSIALCIMSTTYLYITLAWFAVNWLAYIFSMRIKQALNNVVMLAYNK